MLGCSYLKLTGGEPLLYHGFVELYEGASAIIPDVSVETNGTLEPDGLWRAFAANPPHNVSISLDSASEAVHDEFRGVPGSYRKTLAFGKKLVAAGIPAQVIMSISSTNRGQIIGMIDLLEKIGLRNLKLNLITPSGRGKVLSFLKDNGIKEIMDFLEWAFNETPPWVLPTAPHALTPVNRLVQQSSCPVLNLMGVLPDGTYSLCGVAFSRGEMAWGKFPEMTVGEAWENSPVYRSIRTRIPDKLEGVCGDCIHRAGCRGSCVANNLVAGGSVSSPNPLCQLALDNGLFPKTRLR